MTPPDLFSAYLSDTAAHRSASTEHAYRTRMAPFFAWLELTSTSFRTLTRASLEDWFAERLHDGWSPNVVNATFANPLRPFLKWARAHHHLRTDPTQGVRLPLRTPERRRNVSPEDFAKLLATAYQRAALPGKDPYYAEIPSLLITAWETGLRCSDCCLMEWSSLDLPARLLRLATRKGRRRQQLLEIPISQTLADHLQHLEHLDIYVHPLLAVRYLQTRSTLIAHFETLFQAAGVHATFHSLRHGFVSRLVNSGVDLLTVGSITGQTLETLKRYAHVSIDAKRKAIEHSATTQIHALNFRQVA